MNKWVIIEVETNEIIAIYKGTLTEAEGFINKNFEDGSIYVESYNDWIMSEYNKLSPVDRNINEFAESIRNGWIYG